MIEIKKPSITVITVISSKLFFFEETLLSLKRQTFDAWEQLIICDEYSEACINSLLKEYDKEFTSKIKVCTVDNINYCSALNVGLRLSQGNYIFILDQHDSLSSDFFNDFNLAESVGKEKIYYSEVSLHYRCNILKRPFTLGVKGHPLNDYFLSLQDLFLKSTINSLAFFYPKNVLKKIGYINESCINYPMWEFLIKASLHYNFHQLKNTHYNLVIMDNVRHPRILKHDQVDIRNFQYKIINDVFADARFNSKSYINTPPLDINNTVLSERGDLRKIMSKSYNKTFSSLIIKTYKLLKLLFRNKM